MKSETKMPLLGTLWIYADKYEIALSFAKNNDISYFNYIHDIEKLSGLRDLAVICLNEPSTDFELYASTRNIRLIR
jgi:hypothetical protein